MGKIKETIKEILIDRFDGGMSNDKRSRDYRKFGLASHFDTFSYPHKLVPRSGTEDKESGATDIVKFLYADRNGTQTLFGFDKNASNHCHVKRWTGTVWSSDATNDESSQDGRNEDVFFYYKQFIYMFGATSKLKRFDAYDDSSAFEEDFQTVGTFDTVAQPVHHPSDDNAYFFMDNKVHKLDNVTWSASILALPDDLKIVSAVPYGNYLAIGCTSKAGITQGAYSVVYLWDRDSSLATLTERIDFGNGVLHHLANLDNKLVAIMTIQEDKKIAIKARNGVFSKIINEIEIDDQQVFPAISQVIDNKLYFPAKLPYNGDDRLGIWAVDSNGKYAIDFVHETATSYEGIYWTGDIWWLAHTNDGSVSRSGAGSGTSVYETLISRNPNTNKQLISVGVMTNPLPATADDIKLEYRIGDDNDGWVEIFNKGTRYKTLHEAVNLEDGTAFKQFHEVEFRVTIDKSTVEFTGFKFKYEEIDSNLC